MADGQAKKAAPDRDSENAPLLNGDRSEHPYGEDVEDQPSKSKKTRGSFKKLGLWLLKNRMVGGASLVRQCPKNEITSARPHIVKDPHVLY